MDSPFYYIFILFQQVSTKNKKDTRPKKNSNRIAARIRKNLPTVLFLKDNRLNNEINSFDSGEYRLLP